MAPDGPEPVSRLIRSVFGKKRGYTAKKDLRLSWAILKKTFSREEMDAILSRVEKAGRRAR